MDKEIKRQLILAGILLCLLVSTLFLWFDNFKFHTYVNAADYQYCFVGENDAVMIDGYEFYKDDRVQKNGNARIMALQERFFLKDDIVKAEFVITKNKESLRFSQEVKIRSDNEVCSLNEIETTEHLYADDFKGASLHLVVSRENKVVYDEEIVMKNQDLVVYNGGNKDYTIRNVYATSSWLKTGDFSSTRKDIDKEYPHITIDYLYLKDDGNEENPNDYERFAYIQGKTKEIMKNQSQVVAYYDKDGSLLERTISCVITLSSDDENQQPYTFMIPLHGTIKAVDTHE